jgi:hypothetical protein
MHCRWQLLAVLLPALVVALPQDVVKPSANCEVCLGCGSPDIPVECTGPGKPCPEGTYCRVQFRPEVMCIRCPCLAQYQVECLPRGVTVRCIPSSLRKSVSWKTREGGRTPKGTSVPLANCFGQCDRKGCFTLPTLVPSPTRTPTVVYTLPPITDWAPTPDPT